MFVYKFMEQRSGRLLNRVKVHGPFVTLYVAKADMEKFQKKYVHAISEKFQFLSIGEGYMHDYAHGKSNKHITGFFNAANRKNEHFHIACSGMANLDVLTSLLSFFSEDDLNAEEKAAILLAYKAYGSQPNLAKIIGLFDGFVRMSDAFFFNDYVMKSRMPQFFAVIKEINNAGFESTETIDPNLCLEWGEYSIHAKRFMLGIEAYGSHVKIMSDMADLLKKYNKGELDKGTLIKELQAKFNLAATSKVINLVDIMPQLKEEVENNSPYLDLRIAYQVAAKDLSILLGENFHFQPNDNNAAQSEVSSAVTLKPVSNQSCLLL